MKIKIFVGIVIVFCLFGVSAVSAETVWVDDDPGCGGNSPCNTSIQDAVDASSTGNTIIVRDGTYLENVRVDKRLTVRSENGSSGCVVQAVDPNDHVFNVSADHVNISGFTISGASGSNVAGVYLSSNHGSITDNNVSNNNYGFHLSSSTSNTIANSISTNNWDGFRLYYSNSNTIANSTINNNYRGFFLYYSNSNTITNSMTSNNNYGLYLYYSSNNIITDSTSTNNNYGIYLDDADNNIITKSTVEENTAYDLYVSVSSSAYCDNRIQDLTGSNGLPILYYNSSVTLEGQVVSELILCNADNSNITNVIINASQTKRNNGIILMMTDDTHIRDSDSSGNNWGYYLQESSKNTITNSKSNNNGRGFYLYSSSNNLITDSTITNNNYGFHLRESNNNTITNSISTNNDYGIYLDDAGDTAPNHIFNNLFNNTQNVYFEGTINANNWNTTKTSGESIVGGPYLGGNAWLNPDGTGFSKNCSDADADGICDSSYSLNTSNVDYLPLIIAAPTSDTTPPASITNLQNTTQPTYINWTWNNPLDDFNHTMIYIDGLYRTNTSQDFYNATGFSTNTAHNISTHTVDAAGNINHTWVNDTATTAPDTTKPATTPTPVRRSGGGGGGGGGGGFFLPTPTPTATPTPTPEYRCPWCVTPTPFTSEKTPVEIIPVEIPVKTPTPTPQLTATETPTPLWQQPTVTIGIFAVIMAAIIILAYDIIRK